MDNNAAIVQLLCDLQAQILGLRAQVDELNAENLVLRDAVDAASSASTASA